MARQTLFAVESPVAIRQAKTDRLILPRFLKEAADDRRLDEGQLKAAHAVLVKWAELETSGRLAELNETQMQGDFLAEVFGEALGYEGPIEGKEVWHRQQHQAIGEQTADAALGFFRQGEARKPLAVIELKGPKIHLDRHRSNGRTAVDQCWDYLVNTPPECRWGIVSNIVSFRLYERSSTKRVYEHFTLQSLREFDVFKQFYVLFHRQGLIEKWYLGPPRAAALLQRSADRQRVVGDELYDAYSRMRSDLIAELHFKRKFPLGDAIHMSQHLLDRIVFIAFCEDRLLLPERIIAEAYDVKGFGLADNPRWQSFKSLFRFIDQGKRDRNIPPYNGGLFAPNAVDDLDLPDIPWTNFFTTIGGYDFAAEVNLEVLGHLFERSITELEKLKESGLFGDAEKSERYAAMPQSAKRKQLGIYYTPPELTSRIVHYTVEELIAQRFAAAAVEFGIPEKEAQRGAAPDDPAYWRRCLGILRNLKIVDPACGSGAFLFQAYDALEARYHEVVGHLDQLGATDAEKIARQVPTFILQENLYGVDLFPNAVEITRLALWIRAANREQPLPRLSENIVHGNSLVHDPEIDPAGFDWRKRFPSVFPSPSGRGQGEGEREAGFDCVIGNPPWERIKLQEREFFSLPAPEIAAATNAAKRRKLIAKLKSDNPDLYGLYAKAVTDAEQLSDYCRSCGEYPLTGHGDTNTFAVFAELASRLVAADGRVGFLVPSQIVFAKTYGPFFFEMLSTGRLRFFYDFENRLPKKDRYFSDVDNRMKFGILGLCGAGKGRAEADLVFFAHRAAELDDEHRHMVLDAATIRHLNPDTLTCPVFRTRRDAAIVQRVYGQVPVLKSKGKKAGNPWHVTLKRKFDQDTKSDRFREGAELQARGLTLTGRNWVGKEESFLPLYEAKMVQAYDHRAASVFLDQGNWNRLAQTTATTLVQHQDPEFLPRPVYWVDNEFASHELGGYRQPFYIAFKKITSATNTRTMIAAAIPDCAPVDSLPFAHFATDIPVQRRLCCLANWNSLIYDFVARQKVGANHLQHYHVEQLPTLPPDTYDKPCPWERGTTLEAWISQRVLKLTCTAEDMLPLADACHFTGGSFQAEYGGRLNKWDESERAELMAELDAAFFHLYGIERDDVEYILSTFKGIHDEQPLFLGGASTAQRIVQHYAAMSFPA